MSDKASAAAVCCNFPQVKRRERLKMADFYAFLCIKLVQHIISGLKWPRNEVMTPLYLSKVNNMSMNSLISNNSLVYNIGFLV